MKEPTEAMAALELSNKHAFICDLYTIVLADGAQTLRWTNADRDEEWAGVRFLCGPGLERTRMRRKMGLDVDKLTIKVYPDASTTAMGLTLDKAPARGVFDGAQVILDRAYAPTPQDAIVGVYAGHFSGRVANVYGSSNEWVFEVRSLLEILAAPWPRGVYQPRCLNVLFDGQCQVSRAAYRHTGTVSGDIAGRGLAFATDLDEAPGFFRFGVFRFLTGLNAGLSRTVKSHGSFGRLTFTAEWPNEVTDTDTFEVYAGCDKSMLVCENTFENLHHYRGFPFVPAPEATT